MVEHNGRYLVGTRGPDGPLAGFAEFPGGKCFAGESAFDCAVRECHEEAELAVVPVRLLQQRRFDYPHGSVELHFVLCHPADPVDVQEQHKTFHWHPGEQLRELNFPEGNSQVLELLP